jgi:phenylacetic acid degradation protein paaN
MSFFDRHQALIEQAVQAARLRGYWSAFSEMPSPKVYGESAPADGKAAFESHLGQKFELNQPGQGPWLSPEVSPYGVKLDVAYPKCDPQALLDAAQAAMPAWQALGARERVGLCVQAITELNARSFEIAHAVMATTGQGWMMAFQAGGPHAQDRALEAVAYAWEEQSRIPAEAIWEKPQGKNPPIRMRKQFEIVGRGVALVIGCGTFPTWNTYPGLFAALATGNAVIVKPHPHAVLPAAITVRVLRDLLAAQGQDPNLVSLFVTDQPEQTQALATHPAVASVDFTGSNAFGQWLMAHCKQAQVYAELAGLNHVLIDSTSAYKAMMDNLAFTLCLYSGQMCTTTQAILVPQGGIDTDEGPKSVQAVQTDLAAAIDRLLSKPEVACAVLGAIESTDTLARIEAAQSGQWGRVIRPSAALTHPEFAGARVRTPVLLACDAADEAHHQHRAAVMGAACLDLAQELVEVTDRYPEQWRSDDMDRITALHTALTDALRMAQEIKP